eukprot:COSAG01_NODE_2064_length_8507_cov_312.247740_6_plen_346_part_00
MDKDGNFVAYDPSVDMQYIKDWLDQPANNSHVRIVDIAAVTTEMVTPDSKDMPGDQPTIISTNYDLHNGDVSYVFAEASDHPESYSEVDTSIAGLTWHHNPTTQDTIVTVDLPLFLKHTSGTPVAATATVSPLKTKPDTASQRPPPPSANHVPPPTKSERLLYNLTDILDENGIPRLHMTDKFKEVISREDPDLQDLHQHVIDSGVTASSDAQGLPALDKVMKSVEPNDGAAVMRTFFTASTPAAVARFCGAPSALALALGPNPTLYLTYNFVSRGLQKWLESLRQRNSSCLPPDHVPSQPVLAGAHPLYHKVGGKRLTYSHRGEGLVLGKGGSTPPRRGPRPTL